MNPATRLVFCTLFCISCYTISNASHPHDSLQLRIQAAISTVKPALVRIHVVASEFYEGRESRYETSGSGVIISADGHVVTNHHVAGQARRIKCALADKTEVEAKLIGTDPLTDLAIIKLLGSDTTTYPAAEFGNSEEVAAGDAVLAMGSPLALTQSVTSGIISNTELVMPQLYWPFDKMTIEGEDVGSIVKWIGHDAAIFPGNSGGPLVNLDGEIIGINEISLGIGAAIPSAIARNIARELIHRKKIERSWLGLEVQPLLKHAGQERGVLISGTIKDSPARKAGVKSGDILVELAGKPVRVRFSEELPVFNMRVMNLKVGKQSTLRVVRDGNDTALTVVPEEREYIRQEEKALKHWGISVRDISRLGALELQRQNRKGVLITSVRPGGPCGQARPEISAFDIIVKIDTVSVASVTELQQLTSKLVIDSAESTPLLITLERKHEQHITVVHLGKEALDAAGRDVRKAWLPVGMQVLTRDIAAHLKLAGKTGVRVTHVFPGEYGRSCGLKTGDIIIAVDEAKIPASEPEDIDVLPAMIRGYKIGSTVTLDILRDRHPRQITLALQMAPKPPREMKKYRDDDFDMTVRNVTLFDKAREKWATSQSGVYVEVVDQGGWAALGMLAVGDLILSVNETAVSSVEDFKDILVNVKKARPTALTMLVRRGIHHRYIEIEPDWE
ncbi:MAG: PDZ domain-containing protein [Chitinivibrionales bacterium]|nr:PDZ domain-containing protein [Chitinivibrionales bacterium]